MYAQQARYELKKVNFKGNSHFTSLTLADSCISKESPGWFSKFIYSFLSLGGPATYFDSMTVSLDVKLIKNLYISAGYFKANVVPQYTLNNENGTAELQYNITEGKPFYFRSFDMTGLERLPIDVQQYLQKEIIVDTTEIYTEKFVLNKKNFVKTYLNNSGYMDASDPLPEIYVDTLRNKVDVKINFETGGRFKISEIKVERTGPGKDLIDEGLIRDIFGIKPNTYYNLYENKKAQLKLWDTKLFDSLAINRGAVDYTNNYVPLEIIGKITSLHELDPEIIGNNEEDEINLGLALSYIKKNFLGDARKMTITATAATKNFSQVAYTDLRATIEQPYLFGSRITPKLETYFTNQLRRNQYSALLYGAKINLNFESELTQYTFLNSFSAYINWEYSKYNYQTQYLLDRINALDETTIQDVKAKLGDQTIFSGDNAIIGLLLGRDKTNSIFFPTEGMNATLLMEDGNSILFLLNGLFNKQFSRPLYFKSVLSIADFFPLWEPKTTAFAFKIKAGSIITYRGDKIDIPVNQRFYGGGSNSVRGWKSRDLVPSTPNFVIGPNSSKEELDAVLKQASPGGYLLFEGSLEFRTKLDDTFASALFLDYGNTWNELKDISIKTIAVSTGFGFRVYTSIFPPIRLDFGFTLYDPFKQRLDLNKNIGDIFKENFELQFGIGEAF